MISVLPEKKEDYTSIYEINRLCFDRESEANLVESLRKRADFIRELSLCSGER
jgi:predicted N-acetyltransferase YhbS